MKKSVLNRFKKAFEAQRHNLLFNDRVLREDFTVSMEDRYDELDQASTDAEQSMRMRLRNRELLYLKKVEEALRRIDEGCFGECNTCGQDIEVRRLEVRPTATLCIACKEDEERQEILTVMGRQHKSLGEVFSRKTS